MKLPIAFSFNMNKTLQLVAGLMLAGLAALSSAHGQAIYATPYTFVTIAGTNGAIGNVDGTNGAAQFGQPADVAVDTNGNLYVVDNSNNNIRKVAPVGTNWVVSTIAGLPNGALGTADGTNQNAGFYGPTSIAIDGLGNLYVADGVNDTMRKITPVGTNWVVTTIAGVAGPPGSADGTNGAAHFNYPSGVAVDAAGNVYVADTYNQTIRRAVLVGTNWVVTTLAGLASQGPGAADGTNQVARFSFPTGIAVDSSGNLYVADNGSSLIRKIVHQGTNWVVTTIAGSFGGNMDGTNTDAQFNAPSGITMDASGNLYVADSGNNVIRKMTPVGTNWVTTTLAGDPNGNVGGTDGTGTNALFNGPNGVAVDSAGKLYVADMGNATIRQGFVAAVPNLTIGLTVGNNVLVSWPGPGGTLQTNADLSTANWGVFGGTVNNSGGTNSVTLPPSGGSLYFRLTN
jgi:sugar lactone lactonase YvrE